MVPTNHLTEPKQDKREFTVRGRIDFRKVFGHICEIMYVAFQAMMRYQVAVPVLSAIGCGAFRHGYDNSVQVPALWAAAMACVLSRFSFGFRCVVIALPTFRENNMKAFARTFRKHAGQLPLPVLLSENHGMVSLALTVAERWKLRPGILNPSDVVALRTGALGMYWRPGPSQHIAFEETLFVQTSLFAHHIDLNPALYDASRVTVLPRPPEVPDLDAWLPE